MPLASMDSSTHYGYMGSPFTGGQWLTTSPFGNRWHPIRQEWRWHDGVDIAGNVVDGYACAAYDGTIIEVGEGAGYINYIIIHHDVPDPAFPNGLYTLYGDLISVLPDIKEGMKVSQGTPLADLADMGGHESDSTGSHVHFEVAPDLGTGFWSSTNMDPALFVAEIEMGAGDSPEVSGIPRAVEHGGPLGQFRKIIFEFKYEILKGFREIFESLSKTIVEAMRNIHGIIRKLFIILIMIDLALGTMFKMYSDDDGGSMVRYLMHKFLFYGIMLFLIDNFSTLANHFVRDLFVASAGRAFSVQEAEVLRLVSDPMLIIEKGINIIQPIINYGMDFSWPIFSSALSAITPDFIANRIPSASLTEAILIAFGCITFIIMLFFVGCMIALAYIQFYFMILFSFTTMIFAGTKQTRSTRIANRGLSGVFAGAINLMFYCLFTLMLTNSLVAIASQATVTSTFVPSSSVGSIGGDYEANARTVYDDFKAAGYSDEAIAGILGRLQQENNFDPSAGTEHDVWMEEYGEYWTVGGYGMYQWNGGRTEEYLAWASANGYNPEDPHAQNLYAIHEAQERGCGPDVMNSMSATQAAEYWTDNWEVGEHGNEAYYASEWREEVAQWSLGSGGNPNKSTPKSNSGNSVSKPKGASNGPNNLIILLQLNLCVAIFVVLGIKVSRSINSLFQGGGFELLNSHNE